MNENISPPLESIESTLVLDQKDWEEIEKRYAEPHRFFHTFNHIHDILKGVYYKTNSFKYAAIFHDIVYDPSKTNNEEESVKIMIQMLGEKLSSPELDEISELILGTKELNNENLTKQQKLFNSFDRAILYSDLLTLIDYGDEIWKEYSFLGREEFINGHFEIIDKIVGNDNLENIKAYKQYVKNKKIRLAIYPGTFDPYHKGHEYITKEANKLFDKVIVAIGRNPDKGKVLKDFNLEERHNIGFNQCIFFSGMLSDLVQHYEALGYDVTIVKGLRNFNDLEYENVQRTFLKDFKPDLKFVYIPCSNEFAHISSSSIRSLQSLGKDISRYVP